MEAAVTMLGSAPDPVQGLEIAFVQVTTTAYTYRDCYLECSSRGYSALDCTEACKGLYHPKDDLTIQTPGGPCSSLWECFQKGFTVPDPILKAPGEITGLLKWLVVGVAALAILNVTRIVR